MDKEQIKYEGIKRKIEDRIRVLYSCADSTRKFGTGNPGGFDGPEEEEKSARKYESEAVTLQRRLIKLQEERIRKLSRQR